MRVKFDVFKLFIEYRLNAHDAAFDSADVEIQELFTRATARGVALSEYLDVEFEYDEPVPGKWRAIKKTPKKTPKK